MNTETKHTQTPWRVEYGTGIYGADNLHICTTPEANQMPKREGRDLFWETRANAAFIVRACNEHEALCAVESDAMHAAMALKFVLAAHERNDFDSLDIRSIRAAYLALAHGKNGSLANLAAARNQC